jgi:hypothetical protein
MYVRCRTTRRSTRYPDYEGHGSYGVARDPQGSAHTVSLVVRKEEQQGVLSGHDKEHQDRPRCKHGEQQPQGRRSLEEGRARDHFQDGTREVADQEVQHGRPDGPVRWQPAKKFTGCEQHAPGNGEQARDRLADRKFFEGRSRVFRYPCSGLYQDAVSWTMRIMPANVQAGSPDLLSQVV